MSKIKALTQNIRFTGTSGLQKASEASKIRLSDGPSGSLPNGSGWTVGNRPRSLWGASQVAGYQTSSASLRGFKTATISWHARDGSALPGKAMQTLRSTAWFEAANRDRQH